MFTRDFVFAFIRVVISFYIYRWHRTGRLQAEKRFTILQRMLVVM